MGNGATVTCRTSRFTCWTTKGIERLRQDCLDVEEIARPYARFMALQEFSPTRGSPSTVSRNHILRHSPRGGRKTPVSRVRLGSAFDAKVDLLWACVG